MAGWLAGCVARSAASKCSRTSFYICHMPASAIYAGSLSTPYSPQPTLRRTIEIKRRANEGQMAESLRGVSQLLATPGNLLAKHAQMVAEIQHVLENVYRADEILLVVDARSSQCFDQPERAHAESPLAPANPVVRFLRVVPVHEPGRGQAATLGGEEDTVHSAQETRVVW